MEELNESNISFSQSSGKTYYSLTANLRGVGRVNVSAVTDPEMPDGVFKIIPFAADT